MGQIHFLVRVELTWFQDPWPSPKSSPSTHPRLVKGQNSTKQNNHPHLFLKKTINVTHTNFLLVISNLIWVWKNNVTTLILIMRISMGSRKNL